MYLEQNLKGLCQQHKMDYEALLDDLEIDDIEEISLQDLEILCEEYQIDLYALLFKPLFLDLHEAAEDDLKTLDDRLNHDE